MHKYYRWLLLLLLIFPLVFVGRGQATGQLAACDDFAYSTEEDFLSQGPVPPDGNPIISDGDLLNRTGAVCMRNRDLLQRWKIGVDLGLDAVDVLSVEQGLVAFSTELNATPKIFTAGDLLTTWGAVIPNQSLLSKFQVQGDRGLDAVHFVGDIKQILAFNELASTVSRDGWLRDPDRLVTELERYGIDIWFSIEGTERQASTVSLYDGDLLSAAQGVIIISNANLLPAGVPAGLPNRGVDFGLDAFTARRDRELGDGRFSTELLYRGELAFTDGDILKVGDGIAITGVDLYRPLEPLADFLGTDALYINLGQQPPPQYESYLNLILKHFRGVLP